MRVPDDAENCGLFEKLLLIPHFGMTLYELKTASAKPDKTYGKTEFVREVYMNEREFDILSALLRENKNLILQGAPGVGKTFAARRLAYAMMGEKDDSRVKLVQFHQNYSYEDFVMGYRPDGSGFKLTKGIFYNFCREAQEHPDKEYFFIIDEINRGNLSRIFGELLMLLEKDYRGTEISLAYNGEPFSVPKDLYLIGMMNTADRSLAIMDYALRRRFKFYDCTRRSARKASEPIRSVSITCCLTHSSSRSSRSTERLPGMSRSAAASASGTATSAAARRRPARRNGCT